MKQKEFEIAGAEYLRRAKEFRVAFLSETLGPHFRNIYWIIDSKGERVRPLVKKTKREIRW